MRIALAQLRISDDDKAANRAAVAGAIARAGQAGAQLVVCPEASMVGFGKPGVSLAPVAETLDGAFVATVREHAARHRVDVVAGMFETVPGENRVFNTLVHVDARGELAGRYRKIHLYDALGFLESDRIAPGDGATLTFSLGGLRIGAMTCYDVRFPELARRLALGGIDLLLMPTAWLYGVLKEDHFRTLIRARAIENTVYVAAADQVGGAYCGNSILVDPMGVVRADAGERVEVVVGEVEPERIAEVRSKLPCLANRRPDVYVAWEAALTAPA